MTTICRIGRVLGLLLAAPLALAAQSWDPFPALPSGQRAAIKPAIDSRAFDDVRRCLPALRSAVGAEYYAAVVEVSAAQGDPSPQLSDAVPYADALYQAWQRDGRLDPQNHVLIAMALRNRAVAIHPGSRWADLGFEEREVTRTIDGSHFGDYARDGNYGLALCDLATAVDARLRQLSERADQVRRRLAELEAEVAAERREVAALPAAMDPGAAIQALDRCAAQLQAASAQRPGLVDLAVLNGCLDAYQARRSSAATHYRFRQQVLPQLVLGFAVLCALMIVLYRYGRSRQARRRMGEELARWEAKIQAAAQRLLELENQHPLYLAVGAQRWRGQSQALDQRCADAVNYLFLLYSKAFELLGEARSQAARVGRWSVGRADQVHRLLRETPVRFETGEAEDKRRIFLPLTRAYENTALGLLDDLDAAYGDALAQLTEADRVIHHATELAGQAAEAATAALAEVERRGQLGLPAALLATALEPGLERRARAGQAQASDPIGAAEVYGQALEALRQVRERAALGNQVVTELRQPVTELGQTLRQQAEQLRQTGLTLVEPGFEPDLRLDHGVREARRIEGLVAEGRESEAQEQLAVLQRNLHELAGQIEAWRQAPETIPAQLAEVRTGGSQLRARLPAAQRTLAALESEHAPDAFRVEADNLQELDAVLGKLDGWIAHIEGDFAQQHYLSALADLETCHDLLADGEALLDELETGRQRLDEARQRARGQLEACRRGLEELQRRAAEQRGVSRAQQDELAALEQRLAGAEGAAAVAQPHWLQVAEQAAALAAAQQALEVAVTQQLAAFRAAEQLAGDLGRRWDALAAQVAQERRDRPHVDQAVQQVAGQLQAWRQQLQTSEAGGDELYAQGRSVAAAVEWADGVWRSELEAIRLTEVEIQATEQLLRRLASTSYGHGVTAHGSAGRSLLGEAQVAAARLDWDAALSLARRGREATETEDRECRAQAQQREAEARRRLEEQRAAAAALAAEAASRRRSSPSVFSSSGGSVRTSNTSFGGGIRSGGFSGGSRSGGSGFGGGSRSGGSRW